MNEDLARAQQKGPPQSILPYARPHSLRSFLTAPCGEGRDDGDDGRG